MKTALVLGAGFSFVAGLPLVNGLFDTSVFVGSQGANARFRQVWNEWESWSARNPTLGPEQFLEACYRQTHEFQLGDQLLAPWPHVVEVVAATLATPRGDDYPVIRSPRYAGRITVEVRSNVHRQFWLHAFGSYDLHAVVTTNYDVLIERGMRHRPFVTKPHRGFYYGGFPRPQQLKGHAQPWTVKDPQRLVEPSGEVPLYKLHGSLSWSFESGRLVMYQDCRPAFRSKHTAAIVPPLPEKSCPEWLHGIWRGASDHLSECSHWIVCGYSLPDYDEALKELFLGASSAVQEVWVLDPNSQSDVGDRWQSVAPRATIRRGPGLPEALSVCAEW